MITPFVADPILAQHRNGIPEPIPAGVLPAIRRLSHQVIFDKMAAAPVEVEEEVAQLDSVFMASHGEDDILSSMRILSFGRSS